MMLGMYATSILGSMLATMLAVGPAAGAYMAIVGPAHRLIVPIMLRQSLHAARTANQ